MTRIRKKWMEDAEPLTTEILPGAFCGSDGAPQCRVAIGTSSTFTTLEFVACTLMPQAM